MGDEWIAPAITGGLALTTGVAAAIIAGRNARRGAREQRAPDVTEAWAEADRARRLMHAWQDLYYLLRGAFKSFARRMLEKDPENELSDSERAALETPTPEVKE